MHNAIGSEDPLQRILRILVARQEQGNRSGNIRAEVGV